MSKPWKIPAICRINKPYPSGVTCAEHCRNCWYGYTCDKTPHPLLCDDAIRPAAETRKPDGVLVNEDAAATETYAGGYITKDGA